MPFCIKLHPEAAFHMNLTMFMFRVEVVHYAALVVWVKSMYCKVCEHSIQCYALLLSMRHTACPAMQNSLHLVLPPF